MTFILLGISLVLAGCGLALAPGLRIIADYAIGFALFVLAGVFGAVALVAAMLFGTMH